MSEPNGVGMRREDDRDRGGCLPGAFGLGRRGRKKNVDVHADQLGCRLLQLLDRLRPAKLNDQIRALDVTESAQPRPQRLYPIRKSGSGTETEISNPPNFGRLLRLRRERPTRHRAAAEKHHEAAAIHSITSSVRPHPNPPLREGCNVLHSTTYPCPAGLAFFCILSV